MPLLPVDFEDEDLIDEDFDALDEFEIPPAVRLMSDENGAYAS